MAESISQLYLRLGLQYDELQSNFVDAQSTIQTNMARLARENTTIRLQAQVDISGLDEASDAAQIFNIRTQALNRQIDNQRDRVNMANAQLRNMATAHGANSDQAQRARIAYERERLALANLERELRNLNDTQNESNSNSGNFIENLQGMAEKAAPVVAGITAIAGALKTASDYSVELIEKFRELQKNAYDLNMPFGRTKDFLRQLRLGGGDYGDFEGYIRGITDAYVKGEADDAEFIALSRYGAQITDATGRLKDFKDITEEVYQAYERAKAEGNEIEFLQLTGGEAGVRDAKQFFDRYKEAKEDAAKIFDSGINPDELHKSERALNLLTEQMGEFKDATTDVITPATQAAFESLFEVFHSGTQFIAENKNELQRWGYIAAEALSSFGDNALVSNLKNVFNGFSEITDKLKELNNVKLDFGDAGQNAQYEKFLQGFNEQNKSTFHNDFLDFAYGGIIERATANQDALNTALKETGAAYADIIKKAAQAMSQGEQLSQYGIQRANQFKDELEDLRIELDFGDDEYGKAKAQNDLWLERELSDKLYVSKEEETAIRELYAAKAEQIERNRLEKIDEIRRQYSSAQYPTDLARQLADIERDKESWIKVGMGSDEAEEIAERRKVQTITQLEQDFANSINSIHQTALEQRLAQIEQEKQAWIQKGIDEVEATRAAEEQKAAVRKELQDQFNEKVNNFRNNDLQNQLAAIDKDTQNWIKKGIDPEQANAFGEEQKNKAVQDLNESFSKRLNEIRGDDLQNQLARIEEEKQAWIDKGIDEVKAEKLANAQKAQAVEKYEQANEQAAQNVQGHWERVGKSVEQQYNDAMSVLKSQLEEFRAYRNGGLKGLEEYQRKQLKKQGITDKDLASMTTSSLADFEQARKDATKNLLPNFKPQQQWEYTAPQIADFNNKIGGATQSVSNATQAVDDFSTSLSNAAMDNLSNINPPNNYDLPNTFNPSNALPPLDSPDVDKPIYNPPEGTDFSSDLIQQLHNVFSAFTDKFVSIADKFENAVYDLAQSVSRPDNTINVSINEAHAWDTEHIQVLADRVADIILSQISGAIGGDPNSY